MGKTSSIVAGGAGGLVVGGGIFSTAAYLAHTAAISAGECAVGSVFGFEVASSSILGCSTIAQGAILTSATLGGIAIIGACVLLGGVGYWVYTMRNQQGEHSQAVDSQQHDLKKLIKQNGALNLPQFKPIKMSKAEFEKAMQQSITEQQFKESLQGIVCPLSLQVMRQPVKMECCKKKFKAGEKILVQMELKREREYQNYRCPLCQSPLPSSVDQRLKLMTKDVKKDNQILGLRKKLITVYSKADEGQKKQWQNRIDNQFGGSYTDNHLKNFRPID